MQEVTQQYGLPVVAIANLQDLLTLIADNDTLAAYRAPVAAYRQRYGVI